MESAVIALTSHVARRAAQTEFADLRREVGIRWVDLTRPSNNTLMLGGAS